MRSITFVQAFQFWLKLTAITLPAVLMVVVFHGFSHHTPGRRVFPDAWALPLQQGDHPLYVTYGLIVALFLGVMGLPHVAVRFYTSPNAKAARRTSATVVCLLGCFYLLPPIYGALGRIYAPELPAVGRTDTVVLVLPGRVAGGTVGDLLTDLLAAGAFAAFLAASSGLTVAMAGVISQDVLLRGGVRNFRLAAVLAAAVSFAGSLFIGSISLATVVQMAFATTASSLCPLLVLGIWWRRLTAPGAAAGLLCGGGVALTAVLFAVSGRPAHGWRHALLAYPAVWTVPLGFATMIGVSLLTRRSAPPTVGRMMVRLHTPESLLRPRSTVTGR